MGSSARLPCGASALGPPCPLISSEPLWLIAGVVEPGCDVGTDAELPDDLEPVVTGDHFFDLEVGMLVSDRKLCRVRAKGLVLAVREFKSPRADLVGAFAHDDQCVRVGGSSSRSLWLSSRKNASFAAIRFSRSVAISSEVGVRMADRTSSTRENPRGRGLDCARGHAVSGRSRSA